MVSDFRRDLLQSITTTVADYRQGEIAAITPEHVEKWVCQFNEDEQLAILQEMNHLLSNYYISRRRARQFMSQMLKALTAKEEFGSNPIAILTNTKFLQIQDKGNSQNELLSLVDEVLQEEYKIKLEECGKFSKVYIYLDDCLFSGITAFYNLKAKWLPQAADNTILYLVCFANYSSGYSYYFERKLRQEIESLGKNITLKLAVPEKNKLKNSRWNSNSFNCLWPIKLEGDQYVDDYLQKLYDCKEKPIKDVPIFRPKNDLHKEDFFLSQQSRIVIEYAFLKKGAYIVSLPKTNKPHIRPLGFESLPSLGFGSTFITYRNIANNCPLVLWWGDQNFPKSHPFSNWTPLFLRKSNEETRFMV